MSTKMEKTEIVSNFRKRIHCSQLIVKQWAEELGLDEETMVRMAAPLAGGCCGGDVCGCVTASLMLIGAEYGHCLPGDFEGNECMMEKAAELRTVFEKKFGSLICRELTGYDFSKGGQMEEAFASGILFERCPDYVNGALEILDAMLEVDL